MSDEILTPAPGAKAAKVCGILAIVFALTCVGFPVAIVLGIIALVQHGKAKRLARTEPDVYAAVPATGLVTGIIGLVLPLLMIPIVGIAAAVSIPAYLGHRTRAQEVVVQSNLETARARVEAAVEALHAKNPGQIPSQDAIIQSLSMDPAIQALRNPITPSAPALQRGNTGAPGTVMVYGDQEQAGGVTTWSIRFRAVVKRSGADQILEGAVITHTQEQVQGRTEDGWEVVQPPVETPVEPPVPKH